MGNSLEHYSTKMVEIAKEETETLAQITRNGGIRVNQKSGCVHSWRRVTVDHLVEESEDPVRYYTHCW
jgi:hypothetical protein